MLNGIKHTFCFANQEILESCMIFLADSGSTAKREILLHCVMDSEMGLLVILLFEPPCGTLVGCPAAILRLCTSITTRDASPLVPSVISILNQWNHKVSSGLVPASVSFGSRLKPLIR